jgi:hypothetical protein
LIEQINLLKNNHIRVHIKIVNNNLPPANNSIDTQIDAMRRVFANSNIGVAVRSRENLNLAPAFNDVDISDAVTLNQLFSNRNNVESNEIVAYYVGTVFEETLDDDGNLVTKTYAGFALSSENVLVASGASLWTLGHEFGHALGNPHTEELDDNKCPTDLNPPQPSLCLLNRLMTCCGTFMIPTTSTPTFSNSEVQTILNSGLTFTC